ncbi:MAG TPA: phosphatidylglycerol lysyltransferase domain-containing protein [bacterium]|mgnify:CR=1 FL=1|nr:phosphatidylglycerol lysyltransferase domain-containing protein [bacterium]
MRRKLLSIWTLTLLSLGSGVVNLYSVMTPVLPARRRILLDLFPLEFIHLSRFLTIAVGLALIVSSVNIFKRKIRAYRLLLVLSLLSILFHLTKGLDYEAAALSLLLLVILLLSRSYFTVRSSSPDWRRSLLRLSLACLASVLYGIAGFWFIEPHHFGVNFPIGPAIRETFRFLAFIGDPRLVPLTGHADRFLDSLYFISSISLLYTLYTLFRPVVYIYRTHPLERTRATAIVEQYGRHALDYFKLWPDKSYFFTPSGSAFLAYRVGRNFAVVLADPVGPEEEIETAIRLFRDECDENDWGIAFHQTLPDFLPLYENLGFKKLKIGDDAIVDLTSFSLTGHESKTLRHTINRLESEGLRSERIPPPIPDQLLRQVQEVSDDWLKIEGRRERGFTLGRFDPDYVRSTSLMVALDPQDRVQGFVNITPSYKKGESTIDLMRRRAQAPNGLMDFLFVKLFFHLREEGYQTFNLGMAPMSGFQLGENPTREERAIHYFFQHMNFLFSFRGLKAFKAKYASSWEPRYVIYQNVLDLARHAIAINAIAEIK